MRARNSCRPRTSRSRRAVAAWTSGRQNRASSSIRATSWTGLFEERADAYTRTAPACASRRNISRTHPTIRVFPQPSSDPARHIGRERSSRSESERVNHPEDLAPLHSPIHGGHRRGQEISVEPYLECSFVCPVTPRGGWCAHDSRRSRLFDASPEARCANRRGGPPCGGGGARI